MNNGDGDDYYFVNIMQLCVSMCEAIALQHQLVMSMVGVH
jgi:hypothetical protein